MYHPDIDAWLQTRGEIKRLKLLECRAAEVWLDSLREDQRAVFLELLQGYDGLWHLRNRLAEERYRKHAAADASRETGGADKDGR